jgi:hypothetical protein
LFFKMKKITGLLSALFFLSCPAALAQNTQNILSEKIVFRNGAPVACPEKKIVIQIEVEEGVYYQCFLPSELANRQSWPQQSINYDEIYGQSLVNFLEQSGGQSNLIQVYR